MVIYKSNNIQKSSAYNSYWKKQCLQSMSIVLNVINKINNKLKFLPLKNSFLTPALRRLIFNALIQPHFDYACSA